MTYDQTPIYLDFSSQICKMGIASGSENDYDSITISRIVSWGWVTSCEQGELKHSSSGVVYSLVLASPERHALARAEPDRDKGPRGYPTSCCSSFL